MSQHGMFPIQPARRGHPRAAAPLSVPWSVAEKAYAAYAARYGQSQSLKLIADRGGFSIEEMDELHPSWREEASEVVHLTAEVARLEGNLAMLSPWDRLGAERLADEVAVLIQRRVVDAPSPAGDALLDYREPPSNPRTDRIAALERALAVSRETVKRVVKKAGEIVTEWRLLAEGKKGVWSEEGRRALLLSAANIERGILTPLRALASDAPGTASLQPGGPAVVVPDDLLRQMPAASQPAESEEER